MSPTILQFPDFSKTFILTTDTSDVGCGAVLSQNTDDNDLPIAFASKTFTKGEKKNKAVILKEFTAIHWAINHFKAYLYGRNFLVKTDHRPLPFLFGKKDPTSKLTRMRLDLAEYDITIEYIKGKSNVGADALSRIITTSDELVAAECCQCYPKVSILLILEKDTSSFPVSSIDSQTHKGVTSQVI